MHKAAIMVCLVLFIAHTISAQNFAFNEEEKIAYRKAWNLQPSSSSAPIESAGLRPQTVYIQSLSETLQLIISEDQKQFDEYENRFQRRLEIFTGKNADEKLLRGELNLHWAFVHLKFGHELDGAIHLRRAYHAITELKEQFPSFQPALKASGLLNVMIGSVPEKYNWILDLFNMDGSVQQGLSELNEISAADHPMAYEAKLWHAFIHGFVLQDPAGGLSVLNALVSDLSSEPLVLFLTANLYIKNGESERALHYLNQVDSVRGLPIPYCNYLKGEIHLHKGAYADAIRYYQKFLGEFSGTNYVKDSYYKIALSHWLSGKKSEAISYLEKARKEGKDQTEADKHAARNLDNLDLSTVTLTRARFYTDGGYYNEAEKILNEIDEQSLAIKRHQVEYLYRKARLAHKKLDLQKAKTLYKNTITRSGEEPWYFAPNSCLQLAYIYQSEQNANEARKYFEAALKYKKHEYKNSIDSKARSGLAHLNVVK